MNRMKAIPTKFNNIVYRSKSEARLAVCFCDWGWDFTYEPQIKSMPGFHPDFLVNHKNDHLRIIEYKPVKPTGTYIGKLAGNFRTLFLNNRKSNLVLRCELWCIDFFNNEIDLYVFDANGKMSNRAWLKGKSIDPGIDFRFDLHEESLAKVDLSFIDRIRK